MSTKKQDSVDKLTNIGCHLIIGNILGYVIVAIIVLVFLFKCA